MICEGWKPLIAFYTEPTFCSFMYDMAALRIEQTFTSYSNTGGNADTEGVMRTMKEKVVWINEFSSLQEAHGSLGKWIGFDYNKLYAH